MSYRIALLVDGLHVSKPTRQLAEWAKNGPQVELVAILVDSSASTSSRPLIDKYSKFFINTLVAFEQILVLRNDEDREHSVSFFIGDRADIIYLTPGIKNSFSDQDCSVDILARIGDLNLDAIVHFGRRRLSPLILRLARDGVIAMQYGDGGLDAFWEVLEGQPETHFAIQQIDGDGAALLYGGSITTELFYSENRVALYDRSTPYLLKTIERFAQGELKPEPRRVDDVRGYGTIGLRHIVTYVSRTFVRVAQKAWRHAIGRTLNWGVAYSFTPWQGVDLANGQLLPRPPGAIVADPFAVELGGKHYIFVEEVPYSTRKGVISVFQVDGEGVMRLGVAIEESFHLSFPFVFRKDEKFYMVPEGQQGATMDLYECYDFPLGWARKKSLMSGVCAADTVIFERSSLW